MPIYIFENPKDGTIKEIFQGMLQKHEYIENGLHWKRLFTSPEAAADTIIKDAFSSKEFLAKTSKPGTVKDLAERSKELSEKRKQKDGVDLQKQKYWNDWSKKRNGLKVPSQYLD